MYSDCGPRPVPAARSSGRGGRARHGLQQQSTPARGNGAHLLGGRVIPLCRGRHLRKLSGILLDVGSHDDHSLHWGRRLLSHYLKQAGIAHESREHPGNHGGRMIESALCAATVVTCAVAAGWLAARATSTLSVIAVAVLAAAALAAGCVLAVGVCQRCLR